MTKCQNCGKVIKPIEQYGDENYILCFSCDWELQRDGDYVSNEDVSGSQMSFMSDEYQVNDAR